MRRVFGREREVVIVALGFEDGSIMAADKYREETRKKCMAAPGRVAAGESAVPG